MKKGLILIYSLLCFTGIGNAQYTKLFEFSGMASGVYPYGSFVSDGNFLYGMTSQGGTGSCMYGCGVIFKIKPDGTGYVKLFDFAGVTNGSNPEGSESSLLIDGPFLYGMTTYGGTSDGGTIFKIMLDGTGFVKMLDFTGAANGAYPTGSLISDGTFLYGMASNGGSNGSGTIFKIMPDGTGFVKLFDFSNFITGRSPGGSLVSDGTFLYGMTQFGGTHDFGTIFKIRLDGTEFTKLLDFTGSTNGAWTHGSLISDGNFLYGMTTEGGVYGDSYGRGTIFKIKRDGTGFVKLLDFQNSATGIHPFGSLIFDGTFLYGMARDGGSNGSGTLFKIMPDGTGFVNILDFPGMVSGRNPHGSLISDGTFLYGMTTYGGTNDFGIIFRFKEGCVPPPVPIVSNKIICSNSKAILSATGSGTLSWYSQAVGGTYLGGGANYITPILTTTTTYYVQDSTCAASATRKDVIVTVNPLPTVTANASETNVCEGTTVILTGGGAVSYTWSDGISNGIGFVPTTTTTYKVTGTDGNNCTNIATKTVNVNPLPIVTANASSLNVCEGTSVTLTGGGASSYVWTGEIINGQGFIPAITTTYTVTGTDENNCSNTATKIISVIPLPIVTANASATNVCEGTSVTLTAEGASSYLWTGGITNGQDFIPAITTTYTVTGTDENNCSNTATKIISVNPLPIVTANASAINVCEGSSIVLTGEGASSYTWSDGISDGQGFIPATTTTYIVTGTDGNNCSNTATKTITVNPLPDVSTALSGITISANQTGATYQWLNCNNGNSAIAGATDQSYTALINGEYSVMVVMNGCADTSTCVNLNITGLNKIVENTNQLIVFPNPNNGTLIIQSTSEGDYSIRTELGQTVQLFKLSSANNYTVNIENLSIGIYFIVGFNKNQMTNQRVVVTK